MCRPYWINTNSYQMEGYDHMCNDNDYYERQWACYFLLWNENGIIDFTKANLLKFLGQKGRALSTASAVEFLHRSANSWIAWKDKLITSNSKNKMLANSLSNFSHYVSRYHSLMRKKTHTISYDDLNKRKSCELINQGVYISKNVQVE